MGSKLQNLVLLRSIRPFRDLALQWVLLFRDISLSGLKERQSGNSDMMMSVMGPVIKATGRQVNVFGTIFQLRSLL